MKITKGKIILAVIVVYFIVFAFINVNKEKDMNSVILDKVVYVKDGKVDSKNDGKLVLVSGKISYDNLVTFMELNEDFGSIKINRKVEDFISYEKDGEKSYKWEERLEPLDDNIDNDYLKEIVSDEKISKVNIGEFEIDEKGLSLIPTDSYYTKSENIGGLTTTGINYERDPWEENLKEGDIRLTYKYYDIDKSPYLSILAVQKGNSFVPYKVDNKREAYEVFVGKVDNEKALSKALKTNVKKTIKGKTLFIIMILGIGIFLIVDNKKSKSN